MDFNDGEELGISKYRAFPFDDLMNHLERDAEVVILDACHSVLEIGGVGYDFALMVTPQGSIITFSISLGLYQKVLSTNLI